MIYCSIRERKYSSFIASKYEGQSRIDRRERDSRARCVYPTQDTSQTVTVGVKQEEEARSMNTIKQEEEIWKKGTWTRRGKVPTKA